MTEIYLFTSKKSGSNSSQGMVLPPGRENTERQGLSTSLGVQISQGTQCPTPSPCPGHGRTGITNQPHSFNTKKPQIRIFQAGEREVRSQGRELKCLGMGADVRQLSNKSWLGAVTCQDKHWCHCQQVPLTQHGQSERTRAGKAQGSKETSSGECSGQSIPC